MCSLFVKSLKAVGLPIRGRLKVSKVPTETQFMHFLPLSSTVAFKLCLSSKLNIIWEYIDMFSYMCAKI